MKDYNVDTSSDYEDLVDFISDINKQKVSSGLGDFIDAEMEDYKPSVKPKYVDPEFPESWQTLIVNIEHESDFAEFTRLSGIVITPRINETIYETDVNSVGILDFFGDD